MGRVLRYSLRKTARDVDRTLSYTVRCAAENSAGYRQLLEKANVRLERVRGSADLPLLPIVGKESLFRRFPLADVLHRRADPARCVRTGTSGSTGLPLNVFMSRPEALYRRLLVWRAWRQLVRLGLPLKVADVGMWIEGRRAVRQRRGLLIDVVRLPIGLPAEEQARLLAKQRPAVLSGYSSTLSVIAEGVRSTGRRVASLRLVATRGEILHPSTRQSLEAVFGCRVADFYNSEEVGTWRGNARSIVPCCT